MAENHWAICMDIYREMFVKAIPPADFDELIRTGKAKQRDFFMDYYLDENTQEQIIDKHAKLHKLSAFERNQIATSVHLGCSPTSVKRGAAAVSGGRVTREIAHDVAMKMSVLATQVRTNPKNIVDTIILNGLGKCLEAGVAIIRSFVDGEELEELGLYRSEFETRYRSLMELLQSKEAGG